MNIRSCYGFIKTKMPEQLQFLSLVGFSKTRRTKSINKVLYLVGQDGEMWVE